MRNRWVDVNLDWVDYLEARVEALVAENKRLNEEIKKLKTNDGPDDEPNQNIPKYTVPSLLVC